MTKENKFNIEDLLLSVTNFCLGSCVYCNLKDLDVFNYDTEWDVTDFEKIMTDPKLDTLKNMHLTGGEPILSPKLWDVCKIIDKYHPDIRLNMPVSGFFPYATYRYVKKIHEILPQLRIDISVDATNEYIHEMTRGKGSWEPLNKTIELLRSIDGLSIQLQLTLMETNVSYIKPVQEWAKDMGMGFYLCFPHWGTRFGHLEDKSHIHREEFLDKVDKQVKDDWCKIRPLNEQIWTCQKAIWRGEEVSHECNMGLESLDIDPYGNVYPCMVYDKRQLFGNIRVNTLSEILESKRTERILEEIKEKKCQPCIMPVCPRKKNFVIDGKQMNF